MYIHKVMKKKTDIARSSAERDLTISTTKQIEALWNGQEREDLEVENRWTRQHPQEVWCLCWRCAFAHQQEVCLVSLMALCISFMHKLISLCEQSV